MTKTNRKSSRRAPKTTAGRNNAHDRLIENAKTANDEAVALCARLQQIAKDAKALGLTKTDALNEAIANATYLARELASEVSNTYVGIMLPVHPSEREAVKIKTYRTYDRNGKPIRVTIPS